MNGHQVTGDGGIVDQGQAVQVAPSDAELERAIASVPGVVSAGIDRSVGTGKSRMRLRLAPGEDEEAVAWSVAATLRERFGIALDPDAIRPRPAGSVVAKGDPVHVVRGFEGGEATSEADTEVERPRSPKQLADTRDQLGLAAAQALDDVAGLSGVEGLDGVEDLDGVIDLAERLDATGSTTAGSVRVEAATSEPEFRADGRTVIPRAAIRDLRIHRDARSVQVAVVLGHGDRAEEGQATSVPTSHGTLRAVAEATVAALRGFSAGPLLVGIDRVSANHEEDSPVATVVLSLLTRRGEERLLGASIIHDCPERAVLRATLDALNRRVMPLLLDRDGESDPDGEG